VLAGRDRLPDRRVALGRCGPLLRPKRLLITGILLDAKGGRRYFLNFYARRTLRIFPLYYGLLAGVAVACVLWPDSPVAATFRGRGFWLWSYLSNVETARHGWVYEAPGGFSLNHLWSLAVEEHFYLVRPAVVLLLGRRGLLATCAGLCVLAAAARYWFVARHQPLTAYVLTPCRIDTIAIGAAVAVAARWVGVRRLVVPAMVTGSTAAVSVVVLALRLRGLPAGDRLTMLYGLPAVGWAAGSVLVLCVAVGRTSIAGRAISVPPLRFLGRYSYGLYVYHLPVTVLLPFVGRLLPGVPWSALVLAGGCLLALAAAVASYHLFERPILRLKRYFPMERPVPANRGTGEQASATAGAGRPVGR